MVGKPLLQNLYSILGACLTTTNAIIIIYTQCTCPAASTEEDVPSEEPSEEPTPVSEEATISMSPPEVSEPGGTEGSEDVQPTPDGIVGEEDEEEEEDSDSSESSESDETSFSLTDSTDKSDSSDCDSETGTGTQGSKLTGRSGSTGRSGTTGRTGTTGRSGSQTTGSRSNTRCPMVRNLLRRGCTESCVMEDADGCPSCSRSCLGMQY